MNIAGNGSDIFTIAASSGRQPYAIANQYITCHSDAVLLSTGDSYCRTLLARLIINILCPMDLEACNDINAIIRHVLRRRFYVENYHTEATFRLSQSNPRGQIWSVLSEENAVSDLPVDVQNQLEADILQGRGNLLASEIHIPYHKRMIRYIALHARLRAQPTLTLKNIQTPKIMAPCDTLSKAYIRRLMPGMSALPTTDPQRSLEMRLKLALDAVTTSRIRAT